LINVLEARWGIFVPVLLDEWMAEVRLEESSVCCVKLGVLGNNSSFSPHADWCISWFISWVSLGLEEFRHA